MGRPHLFVERAFFAIDGVFNHGSDRPLNGGLDNWSSKEGILHTASLCMSVHRFTHQYSINKWIVVISEKGNRKSQL